MFTRVTGDRRLTYTSAITVEADQKILTVKAKKREEDMVWKTRVPVYGSIREYDARWFRIGTIDQQDRMTDRVLGAIEDVRVSDLTRNPNVAPLDAALMVETLKSQSRDVSASFLLRDEVDVLLAGHTDADGNSSSDHFVFEWCESQIPETGTEMLVGFNVTYTDPDESLKSNTFYVSVKLRPADAPILSSR